MTRPMPNLWARYGLVAALVIIVTSLHYVTGMHLHHAHGIYRRLYYFPIILAAFRGGWPAGLITSLAVCAIYLPHAMGHIGHDPGSPLEKSLEMGLYVAVGLVCGILVTRQERTRSALEDTAARLGESLDEKSRMEAELLRQARLAAVGRLSAGLAHEIRNPLASIKGAAEILADDARDGDPKARLLGILQLESSRLNDVLTRFLAFARPSDRNPVRFDLTAEARDVAELLGHRDGGVSPEGPGFAVEPCEIEGDREQIRQVLINLTLNGLEAVGDRGVVRLSVVRRSDAAVCTVEDDGPGFSSESLLNLGTPFYTTKEGGTGLGLAICHRIVEDHGGVLTVDEHLTTGSAVTVELPIAGRERGR